MTPPPEFSEPRRSFVKKSLATTVSISFAGLIRAHGDEVGQTTIGTYSTTEIETTIMEYTTAPETSVQQTTIMVLTTEASTSTQRPKKKRWKCRKKFGFPKDDEYTAEELEEEARTQSTIPSNLNVLPPSEQIQSGPVVEEYWPEGKPDGPPQTDRRCENGPKLENWEDPVTKKFYPSWTWDYVEEEREFDESDPPGT